MKGLSLLKRTAEGKFPFGFYASTVVDGLTVGISRFPFKEGPKENTMVFLTLKNSPEVLEEFRRAAKELNVLNLLKVQKQTLYDFNLLESGDYFLVKGEFQGINLSLETFKPFIELKKRLEPHLFAFKGIEADYAKSASEYSTGEKWADAMVEAASEAPFKAVIPLDSYYSTSFEVNSVVSGSEEPLRVFAGVRKRLYSGFISPEEVEVSYPSSAFLEVNHGKLYAVVPLHGITINEALKELRRARVKERGEEEDIKIRF